MLLRNRPIVLPQGDSSQNHRNPIALAHLEEIRASILPTAKTCQPVETLNRRARSRRCLTRAICTLTVSRALALTGIDE